MSGSAGRSPKSWLRTYLPPTIRRWHADRHACHNHQYGVSQDQTHNAPAPSVARDLPPECGAAELQVRGAARGALRIGARRAAFGRGPRLHVQVEAYLLFQIAVDALAVPQERKPPPEFAKPQKVKRELRYATWERPDAPKPGRAGDVANSVSGEERK